MTLDLTDDEARAGETLQRERTFVTFDELDAADPPSDAVEHWNNHPCARS
jgi:hypothetical protein